MRPSRAVLLALLAGGLWFAPAARAQQQESGFLDRLDHPDRTLHYGPSDKQFAISSKVSGRQAAVKSFSLGGSPTLRAGDGSFHTHAFQSKDGFRTEAYSTRAAAAGKQTFAQNDRTFGTKTVAVSEDRAANKSAPIQEYAPGNKLFLGRGKRQDTIDELRQQKNLTIDQVREILNKNK